MLTSDAVDFFGSDRKTAHEFRRFLSREAFERAQMFSYGTYHLVRLLARLPQWTRGMTKVRRNANKVIMYMMQVHMLHEMFVDHPRWASTAPESKPSSSCQPVAALG